MSQRSEIESLQYFIDNRITGMQNQLNTRIEDTKSELRGDISELRKSVEGQLNTCITIRKDFNTRVSSLEHWRYKVVGIAVGVSFIIAILVK